MLIELKLFNERLDKLTRAIFEKIALCYYPNVVKDEEKNTNIDHSQNVYENKTNKTSVATLYQKMVLF